MIEKVKKKISLNIVKTQLQMLFFHWKKKGIKSNISGTRDVGVVKPLYHKDDKPLFPVLEKKFDANAAKYIALSSIEEAIKRPKKKSNFEKLAINATIVSFVLLSAFGFVFGKESMAKLIPNNFGSHVKGELSYVFGPYVNELESNYSKFKKNASNLGQNSSQLASSIFSVDGLQSVSGWIKDTAYKIIKPWLSNNGGTIIVENNTSSTTSPTSAPTSAGASIAKTVFVASSDRNYVDTQIAQLKNYFLTLPFVSNTVPNVNRYYITNQNDRIIDNLSGSIKNSIANIDSSTITNSSFSGSSVSADSGSFTSLSVSDSATFGTTTATNLSATDWLAVGTTTRQDTLTLDGAFYIASTSIPSDSSSRLYNSNGDLYWAGNIIGGATTGNWATDGTNVWRASGNVSFLYSSSTIYSSFNTASTTNLIVGNNSFNNLLGSGLINTGGALTLDTSVVNSYIDASTTIAKLYKNNIFTGLQTFANASSTLFSSVYASSTNAYFGTLSLSGNDLQTSLNTLNNGKIEMGTTSISSIISLPNLLITKSQVSDFGSPLYSYDAFTHPSVGVSATTSILSFGYSSSTAYSSFNTASTTNLIVNGESFNDLTGSGLQISGNALTLNLANANIWTGLQTFTNASSTLFSSTYALSTNVFFGTLSLGGTDLQTTLNGKQGTISVTWPITLSGTTVGFGGLSTSCAAVIGNIPYFTGVNTFGNVATSSINTAEPLWPEMPQATLQPASSLLL